MSSVQKSPGKLVRTQNARPNLQSFGSSGYGDSAFLTNSQEMLIVGSLGVASENCYAGLYCILGETLFDVLIFLLMLRAFPYVVIWLHEHHFQWLPGVVCVL